MAFGAIKHKTRGKKAFRAEMFGSKSLRVSIKLTRFRYGRGSVRYNATACFHPGWKAGNDYEYANGRRAIYPWAQRKRLINRCGSAEGSGPSQAVKRSLAALSKKAL